MTDTPVTSTTSHQQLKAARAASRGWRYPIEAAAAMAIQGLVRLLPVDWASALGGWLARAIGPWTGKHRRADANLRTGLPTLDAPARARVLREMWDNLGRTIFEYPHLQTILRQGDRRLEIIDQHYYLDVPAGHPAILVSGHFSNWEVMLVSAAYRHRPIVAIHRPPNNAVVADLLERCRAGIAAGLLAKGTEAARGALTALKRGEAVGMLTDQRLSRGIDVPLLGRPARTPTAAAELALRFNCPLIPVRLQRLAGCRFRITVTPPLAQPDPATNRRDAVAALTEAINDRFSAWIADAPGQWLWLHRRWR